MLKRKTDRSSKRHFTWGMRSSEVAIVQTLLATEPLGGTADCTGGCGQVRAEPPRAQRPAARARRAAR